MVKWFPWEHDELKGKIQKTYTKYISEFDTIPEEWKDDGGRIVSAPPKKSGGRGNEDCNMGGCKFIHVNTVAPFGTFRIKIRRRKRFKL